MKPIYIPNGKAKEYGDYAINIYTGCPHRCFYCFAPSVLHMDKEAFHSCVEPRKNIVEETKKQLEREQIKGKLIHLCFTCDPYPNGHDTTATREIIKVIKESGNNVQILTKGDGSRDFDLLDENDWYGVSISSFNTTTDYRMISPYEPRAKNPYFRVAIAEKAKAQGIKTWISLEPVVDEYVIQTFSCFSSAFDKVQVGKLNDHKSDIDWANFGKKAENLFQQLGIDYYIKDSLREEMQQ